MKTPIRALEISGTVNEEGELRLDEPLTEIGAGAVRVILLLPEEGDSEARQAGRARYRPGKPHD